MITTQQELDNLYQKIRERIKEGETFKSSAKLFKRLDEPPMNGNKKVRFMAKLECFMELETYNDSYKITIKKIYPPQEIKQYMCPTTNSYKKKKELLDSGKSILEMKFEIMKDDPRLKFFYNNLALIYNYAVQSNTQNFCISNSNLLYELGYVNKKYLALSDSINEAINTCTGKNLRARKEEYTFKSVINAICLENIIKSHSKFKTFREEGFFDYHEEHLVKDKDGSIRFADVPEKHFIDTKKESLGKDTSIFMLKKHREELKRMIKDPINGLGVEYIGKTNHFIFNDDFKPAVLANNEILSLRKKNNENCIPRIQKRLNYNTPKVYENYDRYKEDHDTEFIYPYNCGDMDSFMELMQEYIQKYVII